MSKSTSFSFLSALLAVAAAFLVSPASVYAAMLSTQDTVVVLRVGDGTTALSANAASVFLEEYAITFAGGAPVAATHVQTIPIDNPQINPPDPATVFGTGLTIGGSASLEGGLNFSTNGQYLIFAGHHAEVSDCATGDNRCNPSGKRKIIGRVDLLGNDTYDAIYGGGTTAANNGMRTVTSVDGNQYWFGQSGSATAPGVAYRTWEGPPGDDGDDPLVTSNLLTTQNARRVEIYNGQLYMSSAVASSAQNTALFGVGTVGSGTPNSGAQTVTPLPGLPTTTGPSPVDFWFADPNTLYVADDRTSTSGGLQKWVLSSGTWSLVYTRNIDTTNDTIDNGLRGLTGSVGIDGTVTLFGTSTFGTAGTANFLVGISDTLANTNPANVTVNSLASSASIPARWALTTFRGLEDIGVFIPEPASFGLLVIGGMLLLSGRRR